MDIRKGIEKHKQGKIQEAKQIYEQILNVDPDCWEALYFMGTIYLQQSKFGIAAQFLMRAIDINDKHFESWNNLGNCYKGINREPEAKLCFEKSLAIEGRHADEYADIYNNLSTLHINDGTPDEGMKYAAKALELKPEHADANWNMALLHLEKGEFAEGFDKYEWGFKNRNRLFRDYGDHIKPWDGTKGQCVVVWGEQGIGDELLFASMLPDLMKDCKKVIFDCHPRLAGIFKQSFPKLVVYGTRKDHYIDWPFNHKIDAKIAIGDLGRFYRRKQEDFSFHNGYLEADPERVKHYKKKLAKLSDKIKVGISWTGGYVKTRKDYRSVPLDIWEPILKQDCEFISLQYTPEAYKTVADVNDKLDIDIHHWPSAVEAEDYAETAALVEALDLVITVNTSIHHLAGALGKPCCTLTPHGKAWRYYSPDGETNLWYPSVCQFQQKEKGDWKEVINNASEMLKTLIKSDNFKLEVANG